MAERSTFAFQMLGKQSHLPKYQSPITLSQRWREDQAVLVHKSVGKVCIKYSHCFPQALDRASTIWRKYFDETNLAAAGVVIKQSGPDRG